MKKIILNMEVNISVVIPCFNEEEKIGKCLKSYTDQSKKAHEIIVVDGGSTDNTVKIVRDLQKRDNRIKLLFEKGRNRCPANARNIGWKASTGNYVLLMDADGEVPKDFLGTITNHITGKTKKNLKVYVSIVNSWKEVFQKYFWYGRTMHKYLMGNFSDFRILIRFLLSAGMLILPFFFFIQPFIYLWLAVLLIVFSVGVRTGIRCYKKSGMKSFLISIPFHVFFVTLSTGLGIVFAPLLYLSGRYKTGR